jgi:rhomboid protease GluP
MASGELLLVPLIAGAVAQVWNSPPYRRWPWLTLAVALTVGLGRLAIELHPDCLDLLARDPRMLRSGQLWRAVTALFVQDSDVVGAAFNLFWLLVLGVAAERRMTRRQWLTVYFGGGVLTEFLALAFQPNGAGNSIAFCALAGALCGDWGEKRWRWWRIGVGAIGVVSAALLMWYDDIHGIGFFTGLAIALVMNKRRAMSPRPGNGAARDNVVVFRAGSDTYH